VLVLFLARVVCKMTMFVSDWNDSDLVKGFESHITLVVVGSSALAGPEANNGSVRNSSSVEGKAGRSISLLRVVTESRAVILVRSIRPVTPGEGTISFNATVLSGVATGHRNTMMRI